MASSSRTHYDVLGITRDADATEVRRAWKLHVQAWHPDRFQGEMREEAERQTVRINEAYDTLRDSSRRAAYECRLAADDQLNAENPAPRTARPAPPVSTASAMPRPHVTPVAASTHSPTAQQLAAAWDDIVMSARRSPRATASIAAALALVFVGIGIFNVVTGPSLPSGVSTAQANPSVVAPAADTTSGNGRADEDMPSIDDLAQQARQDAAEANEQMQELMRRDAEAAAKAAEAARRRDPRVGTPPKPQVKELPGPNGGRVLRVLPNQG